MDSEADQQQRWTRKQISPWGGRNALTFTIFRLYDEDTTLSTLSLEKQIIVNDMKEHNLTPIAAAYDRVHPVVTSPNFTPKKRGGGYGQWTAAQRKLQLTTTAVQGSKTKEITGRRERLHHRQASIAFLGQHTPRNMPFSIQRVA